ncbi:hypothetical protein E8E13_003232 [Curvularia kusanoi]|uniref:Protein kinase domain-containing protein n=1 Tax=Curvularia kusanoi TaxID=90978 RepID=A0A9P4T4K4_CURKU|nr:hypothetical protein E8E13_003232 [Curvularia kusanoi]
MSTRSTTVSSSLDAPVSEQCPWTYQPSEDMARIESFEGYCAGGYYPVRIGDQLCSSRYRIVHKLGHGSYSTIWLARDEHLAKYVAIKIAISQPERVEGTIIRKMWEEEGCTVRSSTGVALVPEILDEFEAEGTEIQGVRGLHHCLVTTPARMSISDARDASSMGMFQPMVARAIAAQLIQAVASVHAQGVVHAGKYLKERTKNLHEKNILFCLPDTIDDLTPDELCQKYGHPRPIEVKRMDKLPLDQWVPPYGVKPIRFRVAADKISLAESRVFLNDFGESFQPAIDSRLSTHIPYELRSPEMFMEPEAQVSFPADVWSLACVIFAVMGRGYPFAAVFPTKDEILCQHVDALGRLPDEWWTTWAARDQYYDDQGRSLDGSQGLSLKERLERFIQKQRRRFGMAEMEDEEKQAFLVLMEKMLKFRPEDRLSAQQALESTWMQNWAMPAFKLMEDLLST